MDDTVTPLVEKIPKENRAGFPLVAFSPVFPDGKTGRPARSGPALRGRPRRQAGERPSPMMGDFYIQNISLRIGQLKVPFQ